MKKFMWTLSTLAMFGLLSCGGGSEEAKALLNRLLRVVGVPYSIVVNICQDDNDNGVCEAKELQTKVTINKGDDLNSILQKVSLTTEGEYFLENYDPTKRIIMEIQDSTNVAVNQGKFSFDYNPETQELSILQMMIDKGYLTPDDVNAVREMPNVNNFSEVLFRDFETNLNTLGEQDLSSPRAVLANMSEMADELLANGVRDTLPQAITNCNGDQTCVDEILAPVSEELLIDENESVVIKRTETGTLKQLLSNKKFYTKGLDAEGSIELYSNQFNSDATVYNWEIIEGKNRGEKGTNTVVIDGNKMTDQTENEVYLLLGKYPDYLLYQNNNQEAKLYFELASLKNDLTQERSPHLSLEKLIVGKTYYTTVCDSYLKNGENVSNNHVERLEFDLDRKTFHISWMQDGEMKRKVYSYAIDGEILRLTVENGEKFTFKDIKDQADHISFSSGGNFWKQEEDAQRSLDNGACQETERPQTIGFTKEMILNKVVYELAYVEEDGTKGYGKTIYQSDTLATRHEVALSTEGEVVEDETFEVHFSLDKGNIVYEAGNDYIFWRFNSQDEHAWYITVQTDIGNNGTIDFSEDKILHFEKPADFPAEL